MKNLMVFVLLVCACGLSGCYTTADAVDRTSSQYAHASSLREMIANQVLVLKSKIRSSPNDSAIQQDLKDAIQDQNESLALENAEARANREAIRNNSREEHERNRRGRGTMVRLDTDFFLKGEAEKRQAKYDLLWSRYQDRASRI